MDFGEHANRKRDRRLRRRLLHSLHAARVSPQGGLSGRVLVDVVVSAGGESFESDDHANGLLGDLKAGGYVDVLDKRTEPRRQLFALERLFCTVTHKGRQLVNKSIDRDPDIEDDRDPEEF